MATQVKHHGAVAFGDMTTFHGRQIAPPVHFTDYVGSNPPESLLEVLRAKTNKFIGCVHAQQVNVPFHNKISGHPVFDNNIYESFNIIPSVIWSNVVTRGVRIQNFLDVQYRNQYIDVSSLRGAYGSSGSSSGSSSGGGSDPGLDPGLDLSPESPSAGVSSEVENPDGSTTTFYEDGHTETENLDGTITYSFPTMAEAPSYTFSGPVSPGGVVSGGIGDSGSTGGSGYGIEGETYFFAEAGKWQSSPSDDPQDLSTQGFRFKFTRSTFQGLSSSMEGRLEVGFRAGGEHISVVLSNAEAPSVYRDGELLRPDSNASNPGAPSGDLLGGKDSDRGIIDVLVLGGKIQIIVMGYPYTISQAKLSSASIIDYDAGIVTLSGGMGFPSGVFNVVVTRGGRAITGDVSDIVSFSRIGEDTFSATLPVGVEVGDTVQIVEAMIDRVYLEAVNFTHLSFSVHPTRWASTWGWTSVSGEQTGYPISEDMRFWVDTAHGSGYAPLNPYLLLGSTVDVSLFPGSVGLSIATYTAAIENPLPSRVGALDYDAYAGVPYSEFTAAIYRVHGEQEGVVDETSPPAAVVIAMDAGEGYPVKSWSVTQSLDIQSLVARKSLRVTLDNYRGIAWLQSWLTANYGASFAGAGNIGLSLRWGWQHQTAAGYHDPAWFGSGSDNQGFSQFWGICDTFRYANRGQPRGRLILEAVDPMAILEDGPLLAPPCMDGWNHFYAYAWILAYRGVPLSRMGFASLVPSDPRGVAAGDLAPYFLPTGLGMQPWTPVNSQTPAGEFAGQIRQVTGFAHYVDQFGIHQYIPFIPSTSSPALRTFTHGGPEQSDGALTGLFDCNVSISTKDVRNSVSLLGIDEFSTEGWKDILVSLHDNASIYSPPGSQPQNYIGYKKPFIWMDARFANQGFANAAALRLYNILRFPTVTSEISGFGQPDMNILSKFLLNDYQSGVMGVPFYVMSMESSCTVEEAMPLPATRISGRFIPDPV